MVIKRTPTRAKTETAPARTKTDREQRIAALRSHARSVASALPPFAVEALKVANTVAGGLHGRRRPGQGDSFWQFRPYQEGDSRSQIDWRRSAVSQRTFIREREWETAQSILIWRDSSESMRFRHSPKHPTKLDRATTLALAAVALLTEAGEQVGILEGKQFPQSGPGVVGRLAQALVYMEESPSQSLPPVQNIPRYSELVFIGDFLDPPSDLEDIMRIYAQMGCRGHLIQVLDPAEATLPFKGRVLFKGMEHQSRSFIPNVETVKPDYEKRFLTHQTALETLARRYNWTFITSFTHKPMEPVLLALGNGMGRPR